ncbi:hypothetical protein MJG53_004015 [Ovis ammon polii x Ovis aries]|uniref:Uncharacterized protein n=3 Tax=Ovis TaxID=9935 RepID=A0A836A971_SHEEP|nr:hypothetical protein JEQ12_015065 [Ovis aries]KAI4545961.1 hypothetical protein MG293_002516 [Ovis ammon polii]KAI4576215.1 hypothetical protein MJT46_002050 [Ovis ammon polii x Ovis aries]KAI4586228.1 hypothetical protein MJG53_004015 [Ovis ammon polii x Ovis aries]
MLLLDGNRSKAQQPCLRGADFPAGDGEEVRQGKRRLCQETLFLKRSGGRAWNARVQAAVLTPLLRGGVTKVSEGELETLSLSFPTPPPYSLSLVDWKDLPKKQLGFQRTRGAGMKTQRTGGFGI